MFYLSGFDVLMVKHVGVNRSVRESCLTIQNKKYLIKNLFFFAKNAAKVIIFLLPLHQNWRP